MVEGGLGRPVPEINRQVMFDILANFCLSRSTTKLFNQPWAETPPWVQLLLIPTAAPRLGSSREMDGKSRYVIGPFERFRPESKLRNRTGMLRRCAGWEGVCGSPLLLTQYRKQVFRGRIQGKLCIKVNFELSGGSGV